MDGRRPQPSLKNCQCCLLIMHLMRDQMCLADEDGNPSFLVMEQIADES